jgi:hypothetical protein
LGYNLTTKIFTFFHVLSWVLTKTYSCVTTILKIQNLPFDQKCSHCSFVCHLSWSSNYWKLLIFFLLIFFSFSRIVHKQPGILEAPGCKLYCQTLFFKVENRYKENHIADGLWDLWLAEGICHLHCCTRTSSFFIAEQYSMVWIYYPLSIS